MFVLAANANAKPRPPHLCVDQTDACIGPTAPPGADLEARNARFIGTGGSNSNDGRTHATRWATTAPARSLPAGTDVYILAGTDNGRRSWVIDWNGTATDKVIIGCYYIDKENGDKATSCHEGSLAGTLPRPQIRGTYSAECRQSTPSTCPVDSSSAVPASKWTGLIEVRASHVVVQDLELRDSSGVGIRHDGSFERTHLTVQRNRIIQTYKSGIQFNKMPNNGFPIARDNHLELSSLQRVDRRESAWPGALLIDAAGHNVRGLIENNFLRDSGGEGIQILRAHYNVVRGNTVANTRRPLVYLDNAAHNVVEHNHLVGSGYLGSDESFGVAFGVLVEPYSNNNMYDAVRNVIRNNLVSNTRGGFHIALAATSYYNCGGSPCPSAADAGYKVGVRAYGNTIRQGKSNFLYGNNLTVNDNVDYIELANNIFIGTDACVWPSLSSSLATITHNAYSTEPARSRCKGSHAFVGATGITENNSANADNIPAISSYQISASSPASDSGTARLETILHLRDYPQFSEFSDRICRPPSEQWQQALAVDYKCQVRPNSPSRGALDTP